jgi:hypothetical protein
VVVGGHGFVVVVVECQVVVVVGCVVVGHGGLVVVVAQAETAEAVPTRKSRQRPAMDTTPKPRRP